MIVPEELKYISEKNIESFPSNSSLFIYDGHLISENLTDTAFHNASVAYGSRREYTEVHSTIFDAENGRQYEYTVPKRSFFSYFLGDPVSIELIK